MTGTTPIVLKSHRREIVLGLASGIKVSKAQMKCLDIVGDQFHLERNYTQPAATAFTAVLFDVSLDWVPNRAVLFVTPF
jgi:hypothetical protein